MNVHLLYTAIEHFSLQSALAYAVRMSSSGESKHETVDQLEQIVVHSDTIRDWSSCSGACILGTMRGSDTIAPRTIRSTHLSESSGY